MGDLVFGRILMASSLGVHIIFAITGIALPLLISLAELVGLARHDPLYLAMARRWTRALVVLFAVGSVTGTIVGVQLSLLWPTFMALAGRVISVPFAIEVFPFFIEAIFLAIYVYGWDRIRSPWLHWAASLPLVVASAASGALITTVNAFMNTPAGFSLRAGQPVNIDPVAAMFNPSAAVEVSHVVLTAYLATAVTLAALAAWRLLRSRSGAQPMAQMTQALSVAYHQRALLLGMTVSAVGAALAILSGDSSAKEVARYQPEKLAAMEARFETQRQAALTIGGFVDQARHQVIGGIDIPGALSWLAYGDPNATVQGLDAFARSQWPPLIIHYTFDAMVGLGIWLGALAWGFWALYWLRRSWTRRPAVLWAIALSAPLGYLAVELGWMTTEIGRQPWIIYHIMTVGQAFTTSPAVPQLFALFMVTYTTLAVGTVVLLLRAYRGRPLEATLTELASLVGVGDPGKPAREVAPAAMLGVTARQRRAPMRATRSAHPRRRAAQRHAERPAPDTTTTTGRTGRSDDHA